MMPSWYVLTESHCLSKQVNCPLMLGGDRSEINRAKTLMEQRQHTKIPIYEEAYDEWTSDCASFISERGYITIPLSQEEEEYPLAFR